MKDFWITLLALPLITALLACQAPERPAQIPLEPAIQSDSPQSLPESRETQSLTPTLSKEYPTMVPVTPPDAASEMMIALVKQHLAQKLGIPVEQIVLAGIKPVVWRDASLGCPKPGIDYIQVETPGYNILLEATGNSYRYHTDETRRFVQCNQ